MTSLIVSLFPTVWVFTYNRELCGTKGISVTWYVNKHASEIPPQDKPNEDRCAMTAPSMVLKSVSHAYDAPDAEDVRDLEQFKPLTAEEVQNLRRQQPLLSIWRVVLAQLDSWLGCCGPHLALYGAEFRRHGRQLMVLWRWSFLQLCLRGASPAKPPCLNSGTAVFGFLLWEMVKIGLTIAMLYAATWLVKDLSWPAMLVGLVVTMKVYWVVFAWRKVFHPET